ncbi:VOC family protein [Amycolatopsis thailandensis]|uniref:VOC domain-containing protein n=1 Tax=Amycolatopsis thailandensis TaxID=589330 RepID=A0A229S2L7_9PSEU|nr:VOC family protein [Amycolatopsis thailandensis]OXM53130.1 hypothetical protein CFP71_22315 [Amycolatopsis thailandensis]
MTDASATPAWFDISTPDSERARKFYNEMFGWNVLALDGTYALVGAENSPPTGGIGQAGPDSPYLGVVVYFPVDDVDAALERAEKLGGKRTLEPTDTPNGRIAAFTDLDGYNIGIKSSS